jgi:rRNA maturation protein Nop10
MEWLDVRCTRCSRRGRYRLARLIAEHGAETGLPELASRLSADCPNAKAYALHERCSVEFQQLA